MCARTSVSSIEKWRVVTLKTWSLFSGCLGSGTEAVGWGCWSSGFCFKRMNEQVNEGWGSSFSLEHKVIHVLVVPVNPLQSLFFSLNRFLPSRKTSYSIVYLWLARGWTSTNFWLQEPQESSFNFLFYITSTSQRRQGTSSALFYSMHQDRVLNRGPTKMWGGICERGAGGRGSMASLEGLGAGSVMEHFLPCCWIHFSKVPLCTEPFVSTLFLLNKKGELYYCANESSRQRQILPRFLLISKSYGASEVPQKLTYSLRQLWGAAPLPRGWK